MWKRDSMRDGTGTLMTMRMTLPRQPDSRGDVRRTGNGARHGSELCSSGGIALTGFAVEACLAIWLDGGTGVTPPVRFVEAVRRPNLCG